MDNSAKKEELKAKKTYGSEDLYEIMKILRAPGGCPWDREQTHKSIRMDLIEEAYEAQEAIDCDSGEMLCEELGDLLLQVYFHSRMAEENGEFTLEDVFTGVCSKLILRHPHVFGEVKADNTDEVLKNWDAIKQASHDRKTVKEQFEGVCKALPALMRAEKYSSRAFKNDIPVDIYKTNGELSEEAVGELLFSIVAYCKKNGISAEQALEKKCDSFLGSLTQES